MHLRPSLGVRAIWLILWLGLGTWVCEAQVPPFPRNYVLDEPDLLSPAAEASLNERLSAHERRTSNQVVLAIFKKLPKDEILEEYAAKVGRAWGLGTKERDNGLILFIFMQDRVWRLATGYGLEGVLPDSLADRIMRQTLLPAFRSQEYEQGIDSATRALLQTIEKEYTADAKPKRSISERTLLWILLLFVAFVIWAHVGDTVFQRTGRFFLWQLFDLLRLIATSGSRGGSGGSFGGGDSGGLSGGGGDFGGGGASGRW